MNSFHVSAKLSGIYRRYESDFVRIQNFRTELSAAACYYRRKWFATSEVGFDKAIITHFEHKVAYKSIFPVVKNGWYEPAAGGIFNVGVQAGYFFKNADITFNSGKIIPQNFKNAPTLPFYVKLGFNSRIKQLPYLCTHNSYKNIYPEATLG